MTLATLFGIAFISAVWAFILYSIISRFSERARVSCEKQAHAQLKYLVFIAFGVALVYAVILANAYLESPEFCGSCHSMEHENDTYRAPGNSTMGSAHLENGTSCADCHNSPGVAGAIYSKGKGAVWLIKDLTGTSSVGKADISNENCVRCHDEAELNAKMATPEGEKEHSKANGDCADCHSMHSGTIGYTNKGCLACHNTTVEQLSNHEMATQNLTGKTCVDCHDRAHPGDADIYFDDIEGLKSVFCSDCHSEIYVTYSSNDYLVDNYGDCISCHASHNNHSAPHDVAHPYDDCGDCHDDNATYSVHTQNVTYSGFAFSLGDGDFCADCHAPQYNAYYGNATQETFAYYGDCVDCHSTHTQSSVPHDTEGYAACYKCHEGYDTVVQIHNVSSGGINYSYYMQSLQIPNAFCYDCHEVEYNALHSGNHSGMNCTDCHIYHRDTQANCITCHPTHSIQNYDYPACLQCHDAHTTWRKN